MLSIADHVVQGRVIFPGAGYLELVRAGAPTAGASLSGSGVFFLRPLAVEAPELAIELAVSKSQFEVRSGELGGALAVHCAGGLAAGGEWGHVDHALVRGRGCACAAEVASLFDLFDSAGLQYGPAYRTLVQAWGDNARGTSRLRTRSRGRARRCILPTWTTGCARVRLPGVA